MSNTVDHVEAARGSLESSWTALYEELVTTARGVVHGKLLYRGMAGVHDIMGSSALLLDTHRIATARVIEETRMLPTDLVRLLTGEVSSLGFQVADPARVEATGKLAAAYKAVFFFVRAYQDMLYRPTPALGREGRVDDEGVPTWEPRSIAAPQPPPAVPSLV